MLRLDVVVYRDILAKWGRIVSECSRSSKARFALHGPQCAEEILPLGVLDEKTLVVAVASDEAINRILRADRGGLVSEALRNAIRKELNEPALNLSFQWMSK